MKSQFSCKYVAIICYKKGIKYESDLFSDYLLCVSAAKQEMTKPSVPSLGQPLYFKIEKRYVLN